MATRQQIDVSVNTGDAAGNLSKAADASVDLEQGLQGVVKGAQSAGAAVSEAGQMAGEAAEDFKGLIGVLNDFLSRRAREVGQQVSLFSESDVETLRAIRTEFQGYVKERANIPHSLGAQLKASGQGGVKSPEQIQFSAIERNQQKFQQSLDKALGRVVAIAQAKGVMQTGLTSNELTQQAGAVSPASSGGGSVPGGGDPAPRDDKPDPKRKGVFQAARYLAGQAQSGAGGEIGQALGSAATGGARGVGGLLPGGVMGGALLGVAGYGLFKAASALSEGHDRAQDEAMELGRFKRQLGDVGVNFDDLRNRLRSVSDGLGLTFEQSRRLAISFAQVADIRTGADTSQISGHARVAAEFSRATGVSEEVMGRFFGEMRAARTTETVADSRRLSLAMADAIKRSGSPVNADKMLESIASYTAQMKDATLGAKVDTLGFADALSRLVGSGINAGAASGVLNKFDAGVRSGGTSEAAEGFIFEALQGQNPRRLSPGQAMALREAGLWGTEKNVLADPKSQAARFYGPMEGATDTPTIAKVLDLLEKQAPGNSLQAKETRAFALSDGFGMTHSGAMAILNEKDKFGVEGLNKTASMLAEYKVDPAKINGAGVSTLSAIANATGIQDLKEVRHGMLQRTDLKKDDRSALERSFSENDPEKLRKLLAVTAVSYGTEKNQGDAIKDGITNIQNATQELAAKLIPVSTMSRDLIGELVRKFTFGKNPELEKLDMQKKVERDLVTADQAESGSVSAGTIEEINDGYNRRIEKAGSKEEKRALELQRHKQLGSKAGKYPLIVGGLSDSDIEDVKKEAAASRVAAPQSTEADNRQGSWDPPRPTARSGSTLMSSTVAARAEKLLPEIGGAERALGLRPGTLAGLFQHESNFRTDVFGTGVDKNGNVYTSKAYGLGQMTPGAKREITPEFQKRFGRDPDDANATDQIYMSGMYYRNRLKKHGSYEKANQAYFAGDGGMGGSGKVSAAQVREYGADVSRKQEAWLTAMAKAGVNTPQPATQGAITSSGVSPSIVPAVPFREWASTGPGDVPIPDVREQSARRTPVQVPSGNPQELAESNRRSMELSLSPFMVNGHFTLSDSQNRPMAEPVKVSSIVRKPLGSGATGSW